MGDYRVISSDNHVYEPVDLWTCGPVDLWTCGPAGANQSSKTACRILNV